jgi:SAM-dependent methyltransferase
VAPPLLRRLFPDDLHHVAGLHAEVRAALPCRGRILDLGCGANTDLASYRSAEREVWGTDLQPHPDLRHAEWFRVMGAGGAVPFPDGYFDLVVAVMVLEHVADPQRFLQEVKRVLRPGGRFVGHTISGCHYVTWVRRLIGLFPHSLNQRLVRRLYGRPAVDTFPAYYRLNRLGQIQRAGRRAGLRVTGLRRYADPGYFNFSKTLQSLAVLTDWSLEGVAAGFGRLYFTVTLEADCLSDTSVAREGQGGDLVDKTLAPARVGP